MLRVFYRDSIIDHVKCQWNGKYLKVFRMERTKRKEWQIFSVNVACQTIIFQRGKIALSKWNFLQFNYDYFSFFKPWIWFLPQLSIFFSPINQWLDHNLHAKCKVQLPYWINLTWVHLQKPPITILQQHENGNWNTQRKQKKRKTSLIDWRLINEQNRTGNQHSTFNVHWAITEDAHQTT